MAKELIPLRGHVYLVDFDPAIGSEIQKTRPALVIQDDIFGRGGVTIVAAMTSAKEDKRRFPTQVPVVPPEGGLKTDSLILTNQIRTVSVKRIKAHLGALAPETLRRVDAALRITLKLV